MKLLKDVIHCRQVKSIKTKSGLGLKFLFLWMVSDIRRRNQLSFIQLILSETVGEIKLMLEKLLIIRANRDGYFWSFFLICHGKDCVEKILFPFGLCNWEARKYFLFNFAWLSLVFYLVLLFGDTTLKLILSR